jgi:hypothetical protein
MKPGDKHQSDLSPRDHKLRWRHFREDALRTWLSRASPEEQDALVDLLVAISSSATSATRCGVPKAGGGRQADGWPGRAANVSRARNIAPSLQPTHAGCSFRSDEDIAGLAA